MSLARIAHTQKKSLHTFHKHPFLINYKNLCRYRHRYSINFQTVQGISKINNSMRNEGPPGNNSNSTFLRTGKSILRMG